MDSHSGKVACGCLTVCQRKGKTLVAHSTYQKHKVYRLRELQERIHGALDKGGSRASTSDAHPPSPVVGQKRGLTALDSASDCARPSQCRRTTPVPFSESLLSPSTECSQSENVSEVSNHTSRPNDSEVPQADHISQGVPPSSASPAHPPGERGQSEKASEVSNRVPGLNNLEVPEHISQGVLVGDQAGIDPSALRPTVADCPDTEDGPWEDTGAPTDPQVYELKIAQRFIDFLLDASLDRDGLDPIILDRIRNPPQHACNLDNADLRLAIDTYLCINNASQDTYDTFREAYLRKHPQEEFLSFDQVKRQIVEITGVVPMVAHMCINTCIAYTGPFAHMEGCPECAEPRYDQRIFISSGATKLVPRRTFNTLPLGPQLQAQWRSHEGASLMCYRSLETRKVLCELSANGNHIPEYKDFIYGEAYIDAVRAGKICKHDSMLMLSLDGAQLYQNKLSDCWIYIWVLMDHAPNLRYKKKYVIPGPNKPKNVDSFLFPGLHHLAALQKEGLRIWDAEQDTVFTSHPFLALVTADGPGMVYLNGLVGHKGAFGCRLYCDCKGRHKPGCSQYYPSLFKPLDFNVAGSDHPDVDLRQAVLHTNTTCTICREW